MHLTNYAINKHSDDFVRDDESGSKRTLESVCNTLEEMGYDTDKMWANIKVRCIAFINILNAFC